MTNELAPDTWLLRFRWFMPLTLLPLAIVAAFQADAGGLGFGRSLGDGWEALCLLIAFGGLAVRALAVGFAEDRLGRRAGEILLPSTGIYSIVRYPLFLGTGISLFGISLLPGKLWFVVATIAVFALWYGRLVQETEIALEQRFGEGFRRWAARVPMVVPNPMLWVPPRGRFSLRNVMQRERNDFYFVVAAFVGLELACDIFGERQPFSQWAREDAHWALLLVIGTLLYAGFRLLQPLEAAEGAQFVPAAPGASAPAAGAAGPTTRGVRVDGRVRAVDTLENVLSGGNLDGIILATLDAADLRSGDRLVDVGCGSGALAVLASGLRPDGRTPLGEIVGIDATPGMIDLARERSRKAGSNARFEVGTAEALPFADASLDALTSSYFFHHLPSDLKRQVLFEMWRVLKPGGRLVVTDYARPVSLWGYIASFPMRFDFHEYVRGQLSGELERLLRDARLGEVEVLRHFLGYITVFRVVKPAEPRGRAP
jgi:ubiquinone/menaquinone biosynthesis C-methylase UbiE/protein-S-isoprenylcysteine O-methyltransferase Ste14